jgi:hypothetical protein
MSRTINNRRQFIQGLSAVASGTFFAPFIGSLRAQSNANVLKRLVLFYVPNGTQYADWRPLTYGAGFTPGKLFAPLTSHINELTVLDHVRMNLEATPSNEHQRGLAALWTNQGLNSGVSGSGFAKGMSVDQFLANKFATTTGLVTPVRSLNLTVFPGDNNQSFQSFSANNQPVAQLYNPREAWRLLFEGVISSGPGGGPSEADLLRVSQQQSVIDFLKNDIQVLMAELSANEKTKLEEHLQGVREIEKRIGTQSLSPSDPVAASCSVPSANLFLDKPDKRISSEQQMQDIGRAHLDLIVEGFTCDRTRVATLMWDQPAGEATFEFLRDRPRSDAYKLYRTAGDNNYNHHDHSHQYNDPNPTIQREARESLTIIHQWYMEQLAYLVQRLKERNLLNDTLIVVGSDIAVGNHTLDNIPFVFAGGGSVLQTGRAIDCGNVSHVKVLNTILKCFGVSEENFGDLDKSVGTIAI